jgi:hypothetical protein
MQNLDQAAQRALEAMGAIATLPDLATDCGNVALEGPAAQGLA